MPLEMREVTQDTEFNEIVQCECESYREPLNTFFRVFRHDESPAGFIELRDRQIREFRNDPTARWFKVVDTNIGDKVVGAAKWNVYHENPYADEKEREESAIAYWWPEEFIKLYRQSELIIILGSGKGEPREFASRLFRCLLRDRWEKMNHAHVLLAMLFVHPEHRRRGAASTLIQWGVTTADALSLPAFIEATNDGKPTYEANGFTYMGTNYWEAARRRPSRKWMELERWVQTPIHTYLMWRPEGGQFVEGVTRGPWESGKEKG